MSADLIIQAEKEQATQPLPFAGGRGPRFGKSCELS
jgi:hypothetical protein